MSNAFAIAGVTAALKASLRAAVSTQPVREALNNLGAGTPDVRALPPDRVIPAAGPDPTSLNLFLYGVVRNPGWSNQHQPVRDGNGTRVDIQPLALDLRYLLTACAPTDYAAEILLGHGMQALHETPYFARQWLIDTLRTGPSPNDIPPELETTGLPDQIEQIRITPEALSLDDISRIWTAVQGRYRPTAAYLVSVVLIEARRTPRVALPVRERGITVLPFASMQIDDAVNAAGDAFMITAGTTLRLRGRGLANPKSRVELMGIDLSAGIQRRADTQLDVALPDPLPAGVRAGVIPVQLVQTAVGELELSSNAVGVLLRPKIAAPVAGAGTVTVPLAPRVTPRQRIVLQLNEQPVPGAVGKAFSVGAPPNNGIVPPATDAASITFDTADVPAGTYVVRVQVDGAESELTVDGVGRFNGPTVTIV